MPSVVAKLKEIGTFISKQNDARPLEGSAAAPLGADSSAGLNPLHANLTCVSQRDVDHTYNDIRQVPMKSNSSADLAKCCALCKAEPKCGIWVSYELKCWLKRNYGNPKTQLKYHPGAISMCTTPGATSCPDFKDCPMYRSAAECNAAANHRCFWSPSSKSCDAPSPPPLPHFVCKAGQCVKGDGRVSYISPTCYGLCNSSGIRRPLKTEDEGGSKPAKKKKSKVTVWVLRVLLFFVFAALLFALFVVVVVYAMWKESMWKEPRADKIFYFTVALLVMLMVLVLMDSP